MPDIDLFVKDLGDGLILFGDYLICAEKSKSFRILSADKNSTVIRKEFSRYYIDYTYTIEETDTHTKVLSYSWQRIYKENEAFDADANVKIKDLGDGLMVFGEHLILAEKSKSCKVVTDEEGCIVIREEFSRYYIDYTFATDDSSDNPNVTGHSWKRVYKEGEKFDPEAKVEIQDFGDGLFLFGQHLICPERSASFELSVIEDNIYKIREEFPRYYIDRTIVMSEDATGKPNISESSWERIYIEN